MHSLRNVTRLETGINTENVIQASMNPGLNGYSPQQIANCYQQLLARPKSLPEVDSVAAAAYPSLSGTANSAVSWTSAPRPESSACIPKSGFAKSPD